MSILPALAFLAAAASAPLVEHEVAVPMRDGVVLRAEVWRPAAAGRFPVLVYRTPYDRRHAQGEGSTVARAAARGYAVVVQDVRGRYGSDGEFEPYRNEGRDGYDTIEWAAAKPWSDGSVGTFGLSYPGAVQWLAAVESPPHLKAMAPAMTFSTPRNFFYSGGVFDMSWTAWIWNNIAPDVRVRRGFAGPRTGEEARAEWDRIRDPILRRLPLSALDEFRDVAPYMFTWLRHPAGERWWDWAELRGRYGRVGAAVLNLSGWHDEAYGPEGALTNFLGLLAARRGQADSRAKLVIGPWVHGGVMDAGEAQASGDRTFGAAAVIDYGETVLRFMDRYVRGLDNGVDREPRVKAFVMGENVWREADRWPLPGTVPRTLVLDGVSMPHHPGRLEWRAHPASDGFSSFLSDPERPVQDPFATQPGAHDYRMLSEREDVVTFETAPLEDERRIVGPITAHMYVSTSDATDVDIWVKLFDVAPDGTAFNLMSPGLDVVRASYRGGGPRRQLLRPGRVYELRFENLMTGNTFCEGHRLRLVVCGAFFPHFSRNLQTGALEMVSAASRPDRIHLHHSGRYPSRLVLPVVSP
jgi:putative CocE/NonD family hydrolase